MNFSVIIPAYKEENSLEKVLDDVKKNTTLENNEAEIIVVDDGSEDKTSEIAKLKGVKVLRHEKRYGYGKALKTGIQVAKNEIIVILDGDGSYPADEIPVLLRDIDKYDMVIGSRTKKGVKMSLLRKIPKYILAKLSEYLVMEKIPDVNSGLRVFKKSIYKKYLYLLPSGFSFTLTITLAFVSNNERVKFVAIDYYKRKGISKIRPIYDTLNFFLLIIRTILCFNPLRVLFPMALFFICISVIVGLYSAFIIGRFLDVSVTLLFTFGIQLLVLGLIADLINRRVK